MNSCQKYFSACLLALLSQAAFAQAPNLGAGASFSVLGDTAVTCTTTSVVIGDAGVSSGSNAFTATSCLVAGGTPPATNAAAAQARTDLFGSAGAYVNLQSRTCTATNTISGNLAGRSLAPGVYCVAGASTTTGGTLTLNGPSNGIWIFKIGAALTGTNFKVVMTGGGKACNVFWAPAAAVTMTDSALQGNILAGGALGSITLTRGTLAGRALANVAVTMTGASLIGCDASGALLDAPAALVTSLSCKVKKGKKNGNDNDDDDDDDDGDDKKKKKSSPKSPFHK